jgi:hypothetical protein
MNGFDWIFKYIRGKTILVITWKFRGEMTVKKSLATLRWKILFIIKQITVNLGLLESNKANLTCDLAAVKVKCDELKGKLNTFYPTLTRATLTDGNQKYDDEFYPAWLFIWNLIETDIFRIKGNAAKAWLNGIIASFKDPKILAKDAARVLFLGVELFLVWILHNQILAAPYDDSVNKYIVTALTTITPLYAATMDFISEDAASKTGWKINIGALIYAGIGIFIAIYIGVGWWIPVANINWLEKLQPLYLELFGAVIAGFGFSVVKKP